MKNYALEAANLIVNLKADFPARNGENGILDPWMVQGREPLQLMPLLCSQATA